VPLRFLGEVALELAPQRVQVGARESLSEETNELEKTIDHLHRSGAVQSNIMQPKNPGSFFMESIYFKGQAVPGDYAQHRKSERQGR